MAPCSCYWISHTSYLSSHKAWFSVHVAGSHTPAINQATRRGSLFMLLDLTHQLSIKPQGVVLCSCYWISHTSCQSSHKAWFLVIILEFTHQLSIKAQVVVPCSCYWISHTSCQSRHKAWSLFMLLDLTHHLAIKPQAMVPCSCYWISHTSYLSSHKAWFSVHVTGSHTPAINQATRRGSLFMLLDLTHQLSIKPQGVVLCSCYWISHTSYQSSHKAWFLVMILDLTHQLSIKPQGVVPVHVTGSHTSSGNQATSHGSLFMLLDLTHQLSIKPQGVVLCSCYWISHTSYQSSHKAWFSVHVTGSHTPAVNQATRRGSLFMLLDLTHQLSIKPQGVVPGHDTGSHTPALNQAIRRGSLFMLLDLTHQLSIKPQGVVPGHDTGSHTPAVNQVTRRGSWSCYWISHTSCQSSHKA